MRGYQRRAPGSPRSPPSRAPRPPSRGLRPLPRARRPGPPPRPSLRPSRPPSRPVRAARPRRTARSYLRHIRYEVGGREYSAIGFRNHAGGYELRDDKTFKGAIAPKDISLIKRDASEKLCLFEGFMDFLSYLTMKGKETAPCLVLNSVSNLPRAIAYLHEKGIDSVRAFLDNDQAGRKALQTLCSAGIKVEDMSRHYSRYKDLNDYHVAQRTELKQVIPPRKRGLKR